MPCLKDALHLLDDGTGLASLMERGTLSSVLLRAGPCSSVVWWVESVRLLTGVWAVGWAGIGCDNSFSCRPNEFGLGDVVKCPLLAGLAL